MRRVQIQGLTIKAALALGFGLTLGLWLFAGSYVTGRVAAIERDAAAVNARYMRAQELLTNVRQQVLIASLSVRDALLDPDPSATATTRATMSATFAGVDHALEQYVPILDSRTEHSRVDRLRREIAGLHEQMTAALANPTRSAADVRRLLNSRVVPQREIVIGVSEEVQALNRSAFVRQQEEITAIYSTTQRGLWTRLGLALAASLGIALLATLYAGRLERHLQRQRDLDVRHAEDMQRLSAKLIAAQEEERRSIARELHDELGQELSAIKVEIALARRHLDGTGAPGHLLEGAEAIADTALASVRDMSHLLHPSLLDDLGLPAAVDWYLRGFGARYGLKVDLLLDRMGDRLQPEAEVTAYRIIQEALTNVARHARATTCRVYLQRLVTTVLITIEDNGRGFDSGAADRTDTRHGLGLLGIRERASLMQGTLRIESAATSGTRLTVELPVAPRPVAEGADDTADIGLAVPETANG